MTQRLIVRGNFTKLEVRVSLFWNFENCRKCVKCVDLLPKI